MAHSYVWSQQGLTASPSSVARACIGYLGTSYSRGRAGQGRITISFFCARRNRRSTVKWPPFENLFACVWAKCQKQNPWGWLDAPTSSSECFAHSPDRAAWLAFAREHKYWQICHRLLFSSRIRAGSDWIHVTGKNESRDTVDNVIFHKTSSGMTGLVMGQWWPRETCP